MFACLVILDWVSDIVNFMFLDAGFLFVFGVHLHFLKHFSVLFWNAVRLLGNSLVHLRLAFKLC